MSDKTTAGQSVPSNGLLDFITVRDALAASFYKAVCEEECGTVADAARELGIEAKEYNYNVHWPILAAKRCYVLADAFIAEGSKANTTGVGRRYSGSDVPHHPLVGKD